MREGCFGSEGSRGGHPGKCTNNSRSVSTVWSWQEFSSEFHVDRETPGGYDTIHDADVSASSGSSFDG